MDVGDKIHYWQRKYGTAPKCRRALITSFNDDKTIARVRCVDGLTEVPVQTIETKRLKLGWNNWLDREGRSIE